MRIFPTSKHLNRDDILTLRMKTKIKNPSTLRFILSLDFLLGATIGLLGLNFTFYFACKLGLSYNFLYLISMITLIYSLVALILALMKRVNIPLLKLLIAANWAWTILSLYFIYLHFEVASPLGKFFLVSQVLVVGGLAYLEGKQLTKLR